MGCGATIQVDVYACRGGLQVSAESGGIGEPRKWKGGSVINGGWMVISAVLGLVV